MITQHQAPHRKYTDDDLALITKLVKMGKGRKEIGELMGRHKDSVGAAIQRYGLPKPNLRRRVPDHVVEEIRKLWYAGWTGQEIAHKVGKTRSAVHGIIDRNGFSDRRPDLKNIDEYGDEKYEAPITLTTLACMGGTDGRAYNRKVKL
jgi:IS30 family transposase